PRHPALRSARPGPGRLERDSRGTRQGRSPLAIDWSPWQNLPGEELPQPIHPRYSRRQAFRTAGSEEGGVISLRRAHPFVFVAIWAVVTLLAVAGFAAFQIADRPVPEASTVALGREVGAMAGLGFNSPQNQ